jgi:hypothetical protein
MPLPFGEKALEGVLNFIREAKRSFRKSYGGGHARGGRTAGACRGGVRVKFKESTTRLDKMHSFR